MVYLLKICIKIFLEIEKLQQKICLTDLEKIEVKLSETII